ncbi:hypothetical protein LS71_002600 [Helicobacter jaachi]|uniref:Uncharacterized protein n=1 Tax=Helicobacter jaachi TaxID=1677920 RepID=A0A4U8TE91_9HELI|nr:hypothetical protein [Helicobacter jaachi]TLD97648.1 hypothetical protein LS71_002600 [Helicobacter jaachi]
MGKNIDLEQDFSSLDTRELVEQAIDEAFGDDNAKNVGSIENHCDEALKDYYIKLADNDCKAKERQRHMLESFKNDARF